MVTPLKHHRRWLFAALFLSLGLGTSGCELLRGMFNNLSLQSVEWYVATDGDDGNSCSTPERACRTINAAVAKTTAYDIIHVTAGTYAETYDDDLAVRIDKPLTIQGAGTGATIIDGQNLRTVMYLDSGVFELSGITLQNGGRTREAGLLGSGLVFSGGSARLEDVRIRNNSKHGIDHTDHGSLTLIDTTVTANQENGIQVGIGADTLYSPELGPAELSIEGGEVSFNEGDGINSAGDTIIVGTFFRANRLSGIRTWGTTNLNDVTIIGNALGGLEEAGVSVAGGTLIMTDSTITENQKGIECLDASSLIIRQTKIDGNFHTGVDIGESCAEAELDEVEVLANGVELAGTERIGGISNGSMLSITASHIDRNRNGGVWNTEFGDLRIEDTSIDNNSGNLQGLRNAGVAALLRSSISNNSSGDLVAGISQDFGNLAITNSTISGNQGAGIGFIGGELSLRYTTIAENEGDGLIVGSGSVRIISNTLIVKNRLVDCNTFSGLPFPLEGNNIDTDGSCGFPETYTPDEVGLGSLADNGGPTWTHALLRFPEIPEDSPAIDTASHRTDLGTTNPPTDQRGVGRCIGGGCDVGAYEAAFALGLADTEPIAETPTPPSVSDEPPGATVDQNPRCRTGPGTEYPDFDFFTAGDQTQALGRTSSSDWYLVAALNHEGDCWIGAGVLIFDVEPDVLLALPEMTPPPTPIPTPTPVPNDGGGDEGGDPGGSGQPGGTAPNAPSNVSHQCSGGGSEFTVFWTDNSDNEDGFRILRDGAEVGSVGPNVTQFVHDPGGSGPYTITVVAFNASGTGKASEGNVGCFG